MFDFRKALQSKLMWEQENGFSPEDTTSRMQYAQMQRDQREQQNQRISALENRIPQQQQVGQNNRQQQVYNNHLNSVAGGPINSMSSGLNVGLARFTQGMQQNQRPGQQQDNRRNLAQILFNWKG